MSTRTAKQLGPGGSSAHATANSRKSVKVPTNPKHINKSRVKAQDMESRSQRTDITPGDPNDRAQGWYGKKARPEIPGLSFIRGLFG